MAIAHSGSAHFFAGLFATWGVGATAACLDSTLTQAELKNVARFSEAAVLLIAAGLFAVMDGAPANGAAAASSAAPKTDLAAKQGWKEAGRLEALRAR